jgi:ABC-type amino acid transport substrate-binding protein
MTHRPIQPAIDGARKPWRLTTLVLAAAGLLCSAALAATPAAAPAPAAPASAPVEGPKVPPGLVKVADGRMLAPDIARIVNRGELVVAMYRVDQPPFFYVKGGELMGIEVDLAKAIAKELKVTVRFDRSPATFNEVVDVVARQDADLGISKLSRTLARAQVIRFTEPYLRLNHALMLNRLKFAEFARDKPVTEVVRDFKGTVGVIGGSSFADYVTRNFPLSEVRAFKDWDTLLAALRAGKVMAAYRDEFEVKRILKIDPTASLTLRTVTFKDLEDTLGIAVGVQDTTLLAFVNQFLDQSVEKLTVDKALKALDK